MDEDESEEDDEAPVNEEVDEESEEGCDLRGRPGPRCTGGVTGSVPEDNG